MSTDAIRERRRRNRERRRQRRQQHNSSDDEINDYIRRAEEHTISSDIEPESPIFRPSINFELTRKAKSPVLEIIYELSSSLFNIALRSIYSFITSTYYLSCEATKLTKELKKSNDIKKTLYDYIHSKPVAIQAPPDDTPTNSSTEVLCSVCMHNSINTIAIKCGHASLCETCSLEIINREQSDDILLQVKCPICRQLTTFTKIIYYGV